MRLSFTPLPINSRDEAGKTKREGKMSIEASSTNSDLDEKERQYLEELVARRTAELMEANERLRNSRTKYKALLDGASDAFLMADPNGRLSNANRRALELLGYSKRELFSMGMEEIFPEDLRERVKDFCVLILKEGVRGGPLAGPRERAGSLRVPHDRPIPWWNTDPGKRSQPRDNCHRHDPPPFGW